MRLDEPLAGLDIRAHQPVEDVVRLEHVLDVDAEQHPGLRVHGGLPQLYGVHLPETLVALDLDLSADLLELDVAPGVPVGVLDGLALAQRAERWLSQEHVARPDQGLEAPPDD